MKIRTLELVPKSTSDKKHNIKMELRKYTILSSSLSNDTHFHISKILSNLDWAEQCFEKNGDDDWSLDKVREFLTGETGDSWGIISSIRKDYNVHYKGVYFNIDFVDEKFDIVPTEYDGPSIYFDTFIDSIDLIEKLSGKVDLKKERLLPTPVEGRDDYDPGEDYFFGSFNIADGQLASMYLYIPLVCLIGISMYFQKRIRKSY